MELGAKKPRPMVPVQPSDIVCLQYTSGTTGNPKGAMILHRNVVSGLRAGAAALDTNPSDVYISYLPLAHIFERTMLTGMLFISTVLVLIPLRLFRNHHVWCIVWFL